MPVLILQKLRTRHHSLPVELFASSLLWERYSQPFSSRPELFSFSFLFQFLPWHSWSILSLSLPFTNLLTFSLVLCYYLLWRLDWIQTHPIRYLSTTLLLTFWSPQVMLSLPRWNIHSRYRHFYSFHRYFISSYGTHHLCLWSLPYWDSRSTSNFEDFLGPLWKHLSRCYRKTSQDFHLGCLLLNRVI